MRNQAKMTEAYETTIVVGRTLLILNEALRILIKPVLENTYRETWKMYLCGDGGNLDLFDSKDLILTIIKNLSLFNPLFSNKYKLLSFSNLMHTLLRARNQWAHQSKITPQEAIIITGSVVNVIEYICEYFSDQEIHAKLSILFNQSEELYNIVIIYQCYLIQSGQTQTFRSPYPTHEMKESDTVQMVSREKKVVAEPTVRPMHKIQPYVQERQEKKYETQRNYETQKRPEKYETQRNYGKQGNYQRQGNYDRQADNEGIYRSQVDIDIQRKYEKKVKQEQLQEISKEIQEKGYFGYLNSHQDSQMVSAEDILEESYMEESMEF